MSCCNVSVCVVVCEVDCVFFVFKQKTAYEMRISDWSSDVCSSDLSRQHRKAGEVEDAPDIERIAHQAVRAGSVEFACLGGDLGTARGAECGPAAGEDADDRARARDAERQPEPGAVAGWGAERTPIPAAPCNQHRKRAQKTHVQGKR